MATYPPPSYYNPYFHAKRRRRWQMWLKRDDSVLLVRRGAVKPQMVPYPPRPTANVEADTQYLYVP